MKWWGMIFCDYSKEHGTISMCHTVEQLFLQFSINQSYSDIFQDQLFYWNKLYCSIVWTINLILKWYHKLYNLLTSLTFSDIYIGIILKSNLTFTLQCNGPLLSVVLILRATTRHQLESIYQLKASISKSMNNRIKIKYWWQGTNLHC